MDYSYHNGGDKNFQSLGVFSTVMDLNAQAIFI